MNRVRVDVGTLAPLELVQSEVGIATRQESIILAQQTEGKRRGHATPAAPPRRGGAVELADRADDAARDRCRRSTSTPPSPPRSWSGRSCATRSCSSTCASSTSPTSATRCCRASTSPPATATTASAAPSGGSPATGEIIQIRRRLRCHRAGARARLRRLAPAARLRLSHCRTARPAPRPPIADLALEEGKTAARASCRSSGPHRGASRGARGAARGAGRSSSPSASTALAEKNLDAERKRYENGLSTSFQVLEIQEDLTAARSRQVAAVARYRRALAEYYRSIGRLLDAEGVELEDPLHVEHVDRFGWSVGK